jgi:hypothetical protein
MMKTRSLVMLLAGSLALVGCQVSSPLQPAYVTPYGATPPQLVAPRISAPGVVFDPGAPPPPQQAAPPPPEPVQESAPGLPPAHR